MYSFARSALCNVVTLIALCASEDAVKAKKTAIKFDFISGSLTPNDLRLAVEVADRITPPYCIIDYHCYC